MLKVREYSVLGFYVDGFFKLVVISYKDIELLMFEGNKFCIVVVINMNEESSWFYVVFKIIFIYIFYDVKFGIFGEKVGKLSLVDLVGSEWVMKIGVVGDRLKEGSNINKFFIIFGLVILVFVD